MIDNVHFPNECFLGIPAGTILANQSTFQSGQNALINLVKRLPGGEGADGITDMTIGAIISTILELVTSSPETARLLKTQGGKRAEFG